MHTLAAAATSASDTQLILAAVAGIAVVVVLISFVKMHPFLALIIGSGVLGWIAGFPMLKTVASLTNGAGTTFGSVGLLVALGAMIGGLLSQSGGADRIVQTVVDRVSLKWLPWAMAGVAALVGLPLFFEVGVVLLVPIVVLVSQRTQVPVLKIGIPALAGLSVLHGLVPPHPGPLAAISLLKADLGLTLAFGLIIAIPTVVIAGPVFAAFITRYVDVPVANAVIPGREMAGVGARAAARSAGSGDSDADAPSTGRGRPADDERPATVAPSDDSGRDQAAQQRHRDPKVWAAVVSLLLPVTLMLAKAIGDLTLTKGTKLYNTLELIGTPVVALLAGVIFAMIALGFATGRDRGEVSDAINASLPPIAGIILIVAAGGGFKQVLVDAGVGDVIANAAKGASISPLLLGWLVAVGIRVATGSATVATIAAAGIIAPLAAGLDKPTVALLALAVGCGSLFFSHVNDAGFWLVKQYFGMTLGQTLMTWSVMETIISVVGFLGVLLLKLIV
jgi:gluconate:H+ symporter, GntP family